MNRLTTTARRASVVFAVLLLGGCSSASETTTDPLAAAGEGDCKTGANAAWATPAGTSFAMPSGIEVVGEIRRNVVDEPCSRLLPIEYGGDILPACLTLKNTGTSDITVKIPAGLVFLSKDPAVQNGIVLQDHDLVVPAGQTKSFRFALYCLNEHCDFGTTTTTFTIGNVTNDPIMRELIAIARTKPMTPNAVATASQFTAAVWEITGGKGLTADRRQKIAALEDGA